MGRHGDGDGDVSVRACVPRCRLERSHKETSLPVLPAGVFGGRTCAREVPRTVYM